MPSKEDIKRLNKKRIDISDVSIKYRNYTDYFKIKPWFKKDIVLTKEVLLKASNEYNNGHKNALFEANKTSLISMAWKRMRDNLPSLIAPAFNYNCLVDSEIKFYELLTPPVYERNDGFVTYVVAMQNCLLSIKSGLDRVVSLFAFYYKGISKGTTFGHIKTNGKYSGFLGIVFNLQDKDELIGYVFEQYNLWIHSCVIARDSIVHYNDAMMIFDGGSPMGLIPSILTVGDDPQYIRPETIRKYVDNYYNFIDFVFDYLLLRNASVISCDYYGRILNKEEVEKLLLEKGAQ